MPSDYTVKIMVDEGLLEKTEPDQMANFKNIDPRLVDIYWDHGRHYTVPWQFGTTAFDVNTDKYKGDIDTLAILFNPPDELKGQINVLDDVNIVMHAAERYARRAALQRRQGEAEEGQRRCSWRPSRTGRLQLRHHHQDHLGRRRS